MSTKAEDTDSNASMEETITISDDGTTLPVVEVLRGRGFITGKSGSGKSNSASVVAEELLEKGFPLLIVDTDGEYYGLKEQYEMLHVGADEECDLQVGPEHAEKLAELALEQNVPIILDVSGYLDEDEASALIRDVARHLFAKEKKLKRPFLLLVEEIHEYIPETGGTDETGEMLVKISKRGRKHGLGICGMSQRPANVKKDFITQCNWLVWHRLTWDNDTKVVGRVLGKDYADDVQGLADGEGFLVTDWDDADVRRVQFRRKETFDAGASPGLEDFERPDLKSVSGDLVDELQEISDRKEREQGEIARLERVIEEKDERIAALEDDLQAAEQNNQTVNQLAEQLANISAGEGGAEALEEIREEKNAEIRDLESKLEARDDRIQTLEARVGELEAYEEHIQQLDGLSIEEAEEAVTRLADALDMDVDGDAEKWRRKYQQEHERVEKLEQQQSAPDPDVLEHPSVQRYINRMQGEIQDLDEYELGMLQWFKFSGPGSARDAYWNAGGSRKSGTYNEKRKTLVQKDLIEEVSRGEYRYAVPDRVADWFDDNSAVAEADVEAIVLEIEKTLTGEVPA